ncbi:hypothetical protein BGX28_007056 [Mortierella sp. GBA30]|nr:hypothetical protein BGX28_007056 [Mortierella sp. GBA30]
MSQDTAPTTQVHVEEDGHKVFVGNLSFQTTEAELSELFSKPVPVLSVNIITRGTPARSLGYGFVAYETLAQAEQAAAKYNKTELGGREINVEVAKPKVERAPKEKTPKQPKGEKENKDAAAEAGDAAEVKPRTGRSARRARKNRNKARNEGEEGTTEETAATTAAAPASAATAEAGNGDAKEGSGSRKSRRRPARKITSEGPIIPSKNSLFVANLPFAVDDEGLKQIFSEFKLASARVVRFRYNGRSKGYGFVDLVDEAEQHRALEKMKDHEVEGRVLAIKKADPKEHATEKTGETKEAESTA